VTVRILGAALLLAALVSASPAAETRALVVGINSYSPPAGLENDVRGRGWTDLKGAVDDARGMASLLVRRFDVPKENIELLLDDQATRDSIVSGLCRILLDEAAAGDLAIVYFAGHGSQIRNTASDELDGMDETLVPADACLGAPDIRDKEIRRLLWQALEKEVRVVLISDSCHSGSITRGLSPSVFRALGPAAGSVDDGDVPPNPATHPHCLVITATQPHQRAEEIEVEGIHRGALSWALQRALTQLPPDASARATFATARSLLHWRGQSQDPGLEGVPERLDAPLFAAGAEVRKLSQQHSRSIIPVDGVDGTAVTLDGGLAIGLSTGCELMPLDEGSAPRLRVTSVDISRARAACMDSEAAAPSPGTLYTVDRWAAPPERALSFWIPGVAELDPQLVIDLARESDVRLIVDPASNNPTHVLYPASGGWRLRGPGLDTIVNDAPTLAQSLALCAGEDLAVLVPPAAEVSRRLHRFFDHHQGRIDRVDDPLQADYLLTCRGDDYAWTSRLATLDTTATTLPRVTHAVRSSEGTLAPEKLGTLALGLARIWGWHQTSGPAADPGFPYRLVGFRDMDGRLIDPQERLVGGRTYRLVLHADAAGRRGLAELARSYLATKRFLYVFAIDRQGAGALLLEDMFDPPRKGMPPGEITLPHRGPSPFVVAPPYGTESIFLLATEEPLPAAEIFNFDGVGRQGGEPKGSRTDLASFLFSIGSGTRADNAPVPLHWSVQKITSRSMPAAR